MNRLELLVLSRLDNQVQLGANTNSFKSRGPRTARTNFSVRGSLFKRLKSQDFQPCHGPEQFGRSIQSWRLNLNPYWRIKATNSKNWEIIQRHLRKQNPDKNTEYLVMFIFLRFLEHEFCELQVMWTSAFKLWKIFKFNLTAKRAFCSVFFDGSVLTILRSKGLLGLF